MTVRAYYVDGSKICDCSDKGIPIGIERSCKRCLTSDEKNEEKLFIERLDDIGFIEKRSKSWKWIANTLSVNSPSFIDTRSITKFISFFLKLELNREVYRRRRCCMYWLDQHIDEISSIFDKHELSIDYKGNMIKVDRPTEKKESDETINLNTEVKLISNEFDIDSNLADFEFANFEDDNNYESTFADDAIYPF